MLQISKQNSQLLRTELDSLLQCCNSFLPTPYNSAFSFCTYPVLTTIPFFAEPCHLAVSIGLQHPLVFVPPGLCIPFRVMSCFTKPWILRFRRVARKKKRIPHFQLRLHWMDKQTNTAAAVEWAHSSMSSFRAFTNDFVHITLKVFNAKGPRVRTL